MTGAGQAQVPVPHGLAVVLVQDAVVALDVAKDSGAVVVGARAWDVVQACGSVPASDAARAWDAVLQAGEADFVGRSHASHCRDGRGFLAHGMAAGTRGLPALHAHNPGNLADAIRFRDD